MKILLLGSSGQVGWELQRALAPLGDVVAPGRGQVNDLCGDLSMPDDLSRTVRRLRPQVIVNAAAYTDVDRAEAEPAAAERINAHGPGVLAEETARLRGMLVHYSTDYVFDGDGSTPWQEDDTVSPQNVYGATKWQGEKAIRDSGCRHLILRTQWVYAARRKNFLRTILQLACERSSLEVVSDEHGAPTGAELIADVSAHAIRLAMRQDAVFGTYHLAARGETTWHGYAQFAVAEARRAGWPIEVEDAAIFPVRARDFRSGARRPANSRLDVTQLERTFGLRMPDWQAGVRRVVAELTENRSTRQA